MRNPLKNFRQVWAVDTEYIARPGERPIPVCLSAYEYRSRRKILLWYDQLRPEPPFDISSDSLFVTFYAPAELGFFRAMGWQQPAHVLDLFTEYKNRLNGYYNPYGYSLVAALAHYGLDHIDAGEKEDMRHLILRGGPWSAKEKAAILAYCQSDTDALACLLPRMWHHIDLYRALLRGRYMSAVSAMEYTGVPIDVELYARLNSNWERIQERLIQKVDAQYHVYEGRSFRVELFERYLLRNNMGWPRLDSGNPKLDDDTFEEMAHIFPQVANLRKLRQALGEMRLSDLAVGPDGFNRCMLSSFASRTGRNQPSNTKFIFGPGSWLRGLIKPKGGYGIAYVDYSQQEFAIAAALSGDQNMQQAYLSGDPYLAFAKLAGAVPKDATKKTHLEQRNLYKTCVLGTQYGMERYSLSRRIQRPPIVARGLLQQHREVFGVFWKWSDNKTDSANLRGVQQTVFGWTNHVSTKFKERSVRNFPMQANGAEMLRLACCFGTEAGIEICAPVHDALLIQAPLERLDEDIARMRAYMEQASSIVLSGFTVRTDVVIVKYPDRYMDERGAEFWDTVMSLLNEEKQNGQQFGFPERAPKKPRTRVGESC